MIDQAMSESDHRETRHDDSSVDGVVAYLAPRGRPDRPGPLEDPIRSESRQIAGRAIEIETRWIPSRTSIGSELLATFWKPSLRARETSNRVTGGPSSPVLAGVTRS